MKLSSELSQAKIFTELAGLNQLKIAAGEKSPEAISEVATQFESLFVQMMLKSMREANKSDSLFGSNQMQFYQDLYDKQISIHLAEKRSVGIADILINQLSDTKQVNTESGNKPLPEPVVFPDKITQAADQKSVKFDSPKHFIDELRPLAEKYADELGVKPEVLIAQAALETGWGKKIIQKQSNSTHNLFGIKASSGWSGDSTTVKTLEHRNGEFQLENAKFRAYHSFEQSFADYVSFIKNNSRYESALDRVQDSVQYIQALQDAGYATDPKYAEKISSILQRDEFKQG